MSKARAGKPCSSGLALEVEHLEAQPGWAGPALLRARHEERPHVGEGVLDALGREARQHVGGGAAGPGADLEDAERPARARALPAAAARASATSPLYSRAVGESR